MARYDFNFPQDTTIALKLGSGSIVSVPKRTPGSADDGLTLELTRTDLQVAPDFVGLWVTPTTQLLPPLSGLTIYDRHFHEEWYEVDWGDIGCSDYITSTGLSAWGNRNLSLHRRSGHVYEKPGTYTITVNRYRGGTLLSQKTQEITIKDPNVVFPAAQTIVVVDGGLNGDTTGAPPHDHVRGEITSALNVASSQSIPTRILVKRGEGKEYVMDNRIWQNNQNLYIGTFGSGTKPVMKPETTGGALLRVYEQLNKGSVVWGFDLRGNWDSTTEYVIPGTTNFGDGIRAYGDGFLIVHDCDASGFMAAFGCNSQTALNKVVVSQSTVTNWQDYGIFIGSAAGNEAYLLGVRIEQDVRALSGGRGKVSGVGYAGNDHGPLRCQSHHLVLECVKTFSRNAWTAADKADDQDGMRLHMNGAERTICGNRILCEGGLKAYADGAAASSDKNGMNIRITNLIHLGNYVSSVGVDISNGGTTLENPLLIRSNNTQATGKQNNAIVLRGATSSGTNLNENNASPVRVRNPTVVNLMDDTNANGNGFNPVNDMGNLLDAEVSDMAEYTVRTSSVQDDGPFDLVALHAPLYKGQRFGYEYVQTTVPVTVAPNGTMTLPYPAGSTSSDYFVNGWTQLIVQGAGTLDTKSKEISVVFGATEITVTNLTAKTWTQGNTLTAKLDRRLSPPPFTQATPADSYNLYHPASGNAALLGGATGGNVPRRDLLMRTRPAKPSKGALEPI